MNLNFSLLSHQVFSIKCNLLIIKLLHFVILQAFDSVYIVENNFCQSFNELNASDWKSKKDKISISYALKVNKKGNEKNYFLSDFSAFFKLISFPFL